MERLHNSTLALKTDSLPQSDRIEELPASDRTEKVAHGANTLSVWLGELLRESRFFRRT